VEIPGGGEQSYAGGMIDRDGIQKRWDEFGSKLDERGRRLFAAAEVRAAGWGGLAVVSAITKIARSTINRGEDDLDEGPLPDGRVRRRGGGPRPLRERDPTLRDDLKRLVEPATLGCPVRPLLWVSKSLDKLAAALNAMGHPISANTVRKELVKLGFSRQANRKADEGSKHPDRNAQFEYINAKSLRHRRKINLSSRSARRRKSWSATSRTAARTIVPRAGHNASRCTTSRTRCSARWCPMGCTM
jgi:hypothetical protein